MADPDQKARLYESLYNAMMERYFADDLDTCDRLANSLLSKAELPVIIRARCYMVLGTAGSDPVRISPAILTALRRHCAFASRHHICTDFCP